MGSVMQIRTMRPAEISLAINWAVIEGWNPGIYDHVPFAAADPGGFLIGTVDGQPAAVISAIRYGTGFGFIGCYIVAPEWRGKGYGWQIWQAAMQRLAGRNVGLDGVVAQQENYRRSGFVLAHANVRHVGKAGTDKSRFADGCALRPLHSEPMDRIADFDSEFFPNDRRAFLHAWLSQPHATGQVAIKGGQIAGYGQIRPCRSGFKIGPLFANQPAIAMALFSALANTVPAGSDIYLDTPAVNSDAMALAEHFCMTPVFETARMYTRGEPDIALARTYGITSFELG